jgi:hypothetical protein
MSGAARLRALPALAALLLVGWSPAAAQSVRGDLRDDQRDLPIAGARLHLIGAGGAIVDSTRSADAGGFELTAPAAGTYTLYFQLDGWASVPSGPLQLRSGETLEYAFRVPLVSNAAIRQMADMIDMDERLQTALPEMCGEPLRPWEAGLLVGIVRTRTGSAQVAGARVAVAAPDGTVARSTLSSEKGIYILCNVPLGEAVEITIETPGGAMETTEVEIRPGMVSWYDLTVGRRREP